MNRANRQLKYKLLTFVLIITGMVSHAQEPNSGINESWAMDVLVLSNGKKLSGLLVSESQLAIDFVEIHRPIGKPMYLVIRTISKKRVLKTEQITSEARKQLSQKVTLFRNRTRIEAMQLESVRFQIIQRDNKTWRLYDNLWFRLETTLEDPVARKIVVRLEQIFLALRYALPPDASLKNSPVLFQIYGSNRGYIAALKTEKIKLANPAFYEPVSNRIVAGSTLNELLQDISNARSKHQALQTKLQQWDTQLEEQLTKREASLVQQGVTKKQRNKALLSIRTRWNKQKRGMKQSLDKANRDNQEALARELDKLTRQLFHEAFHAYLQNTVYPTEQYSIPSWLNEGLAQVFETVMIEANQMRIDAPDPVRLAALQKELRRLGGISLAELLQADQEKFTALHSAQHSAKLQVDKHYLLAWGLAYYIAFEKPLLQSKAMKQYAKKTEKEKQPIEQFEAFVGMPLATFEKQWKAAMLNLPVRN